MESIISDFKIQSEMAIQIQENLLLNLLRKNQNTEFGKKYQFSRIRTVQDYQTTMPITDYRDYDTWIERMIAGEKHLLTEDEIVFYCISSGSEGKIKYLPITQADIHMQKKYFYDAIREIIRNACPQKSEKELFGKVFEMAEFYQTFMRDGTMSGVRSGVVHRWMEYHHEKDMFSYTAPKEVLYPEQLEDMLYVRLRFALTDENVMAIHGVFVHKVVGALQYMKQNWDAFLHDIETGEVSDCFGIREEWKQYLKKYLPPNPARAAQLRKVDFEDKLCPPVKQIWEKVAYVRTIGGSYFASYMEELDKWIGSLPIHFYAYAASESIFGVALEMNQEDAYYALIPEACFFEFRAELYPDKIYTMDKLEIGKRYELFVTTLSGLYRYGMGDVVEVVGFFGQIPLIRLCYRRGQMLNIADEQMSLNQFEAAVLEVCRQWKKKSNGFCIDIDVKTYPPAYQVYMETEDGVIPENAAALLDYCLQQKCLGYRSARYMNEIRELSLWNLKKNTFKAYEYRLMENGCRMEQNKPFHLIKTEEQRKFFSDFIVHKGVGETHE